MNIRSTAIAIAALFVAGAAHADPIEGNWRTDAGSTAQISSCGSAFCIKLVSGDHSGKQIGKMSASGDGRYTGSITDPNNDKTYSGSARLNGNSLRMQGCVLKVLCRTQNWQRL